jgi:hypothetical protein
MLWQQWATTKYTGCPRYIKLNSEQEISCVLKLGRGIMTFCSTHIYIYTHTHTHMHLCKHSHITVFSDCHAGSILCGHFPVKSQIISRRVHIFMPKVELLPRLIKRHAIKTYGEMVVQLHTLTMAVCGGMWSVSCPKTLTVD